MTNNTKEEIKRAGGLAELLKQIDDEKTKIGFILTLIEDNIFQINEIPRRELKQVFNYFLNNEILDINVPHRHFSFLRDDIIELAEKKGYYKEAAEICECEAYDAKKSWKEENAFFYDSIYKAAKLFKKVRNFKKAKKLFIHSLDSRLKEHDGRYGSAERCIEHLLNCGMDDLIIEYAIEKGITLDDNNHLFLDVAEKKLSEQTQNNKIIKYYNQLLTYYKKQQNYEAIIRIKKKIDKRDPTCVIYEVLR